MNMKNMTRRWILTLPVLMICGISILGCSGDRTATPRPEAHADAVLYQFLDNALVYPESITIDRSDGTFFVGSVKDGTVYRGKAGSPALNVFSRAGSDGRNIATGVSFATDRLVVVGRQTGLVFVYQVSTGALISRLETGLEENDNFLNDVTFAIDGSAYITDSVNPVLYRVAPLGPGYELQEFVAFDDTPLKYTSEPGVAGINVNGIVATADGRYLIIGKRNENSLYRIDIQARDVSRIEISDGALETPDGLFLEGSTLYVVQNIPESVAVLEFNGDFLSASLKDVIQHPTFAYPTSVAKHRDRLLVVNSQFDTAGSPAVVSGGRDPVIPFWITEVPAGN